MRCCRRTRRNRPSAGCPSRGWDWSVTDLYRDLETAWWVLSRISGKITANSMIEFACPEAFPEHTARIAALDDREKTAA